MKAGSRRRADDEAAEIVVNEPTRGRAALTDPGNECNVAFR